MMNRVSLLIASVCVFVALPAWTADDRSQEQKAVQFRQGVFSAMEWKFGQLIGAKVAKDSAAFQQQAKDLSHLAGMFAEGFIANSVVDDSKAKAELWEEREKFDERAAALVNAANAMAADDYDMSEFNPRKFGGTHCGGCHRNYKEREE